MARSVSSSSTALPPPSDRSCRLTGALHDGAHPSSSESVADALHEPEGWLDHSVQLRIDWCSSPTLSIDVLEESRSRGSTRLGPEELGPRWARPAGSWVKAVSQQDRP